MRLRRPSVYPIIHPAVEGVLGVEVCVEPALLGHLVGFSLEKGDLWVDAPVQHFPIFEPLKDKLTPEFSYFGILLESGFVLGDVLNEKGLPIEHEAKFQEADKLGVECIQLLHLGTLDSTEQLQGFLDQSPDGVLFKPVQGRGVYAILTADMLPNIVPASNIEIPGGVDL